MTKPTITLTLDRTIAAVDPPIRMALTLNAWTSREQAEVDDDDLKKALAVAASQIERDVFGDLIASPENERCGRCRFFKPFRSTAIFEGGQCARHAPTPGQLGHKFSNEPTLTFKWPSVDDDDWCGEFERAPREATS